MLPRILETEAMDTSAEALDYDSMDHGEVNRLFVDDFLDAGLPQGEILDLGTGTAQIPVELCRREPSARVLAVDLAEHMIELGRRNVSRAGLEERVKLQRVDAKGLPFQAGRFAALMSNNIVHHIPHPETVLDEAWRVTAVGGLVFFRDLLRPDDDQTVRRLVDTYAAEANEHQRQMFDDSFRAALTVDEMRDVVARFGVGPETGRASSDRHWTWAARKA